MKEAKAGDMVVVPRRQRLMDAWKEALSFIAGIGFSIVSIAVIVHLTGVVACK